MKDALPQDARFMELLVAEDNDDDLELMKISFLDASFKVNLHHVPDGEECMRFLLREGKFADAPRPDLLLLDMNMPKMDGREVMRRISEDDRLKDIPVIILSTSSWHTDVMQMYRLRCNSYLVKPVTYDKFAEVIKKLTDYWFSVVVLPSTANRERPHD